jgi:hypothetical protein
MVRREGPAPSPGIPQIPGLSGYPTRLVDLPGGAAPPDLRYKGRLIAGSWEKMDPRVGGAPTSPVYETGASLRMLTGSGGHPRGLAGIPAIMSRLL